jgi:glucosyl-dolichyl phosphate glucuronosyltransferase
LTDLKQLLDSVNLQINKNYDMFIVVERSPELAESISGYVAEKGYPGIKVHFNDGPQGVSANRNIALEQVAGDIVAFVDDDAILSPQWVDELIKAFDSDETVVGVTGPVLPLWQDGQVTWFPRELYWILSCTYYDYPDQVEVRNGYGTNLAFRREAFQSAGLFNTRLGVRGRGKGGWQEPGGEEVELAYRIKNCTGKRIVYRPTVEVSHKVYSYRLNVRFIVLRAFWEGYAKALLESKCRSFETESSVLANEHALLRRIAFHNVPAALGSLFIHPAKGLRQLLLISSVLTCVGVGYCRYKLGSLFNREY